MAAWFDPDRWVTPEEIAKHLGIDLRFFRIGHQAAFRLDGNGRLTVRIFWEWFRYHWADFRRTAGMLPDKVLGGATEYEKE